MAEVPSDRLIVVRTMGDLTDAAHEGPDDETVVSILSGAGLEPLRDLIVARSFGGLDVANDDAPLVTRERHLRALRVAREEVACFRTGMAEGLPMELAATHLRAAAGALETLIGAVTPDDILGEVFGSFCVGK